MRFSNVEMQLQTLGTRIAYKTFVGKNCLGNHKQRKANLIMKTIKTLGLVTAGLLCGTGLASATAVGDLGTTATLNQLAGTGNYLEVGDKIFSGFTDSESGLNSFSASGITVTATYSGGVYYLQWAGNMSVISLATAASGDLELGYTVRATSGTINWIDQDYAGSISPILTGIGNVGIVETVRVPGGPVVGTTTVGTGLISAGPWTIGPYEQPYIVPPQNELDVVKDISISSLSPYTTTSVSFVEQSFHQITVPDGGATVSLLGVTLMGLGLLRWKQSK
jgi:hypothetical protein